MPDTPAPENIPPMNNPDPQPGDPKPKAPPADDEAGRRYIPVELPGVPHAPERVESRTNLRPPRETSRGTTREITPE